MTAADKVLTGLLVFHFTGLILTIGASWVRENRDRAAGVTR